MRIKEAFLGLLTLISCCKNNAHDNFLSLKQLTLEELCDTPVEERNLFLHVYVEEDKKQAREFYEREVFPKVAEFFEQHKIVCIVNFQDEPLEYLNRHDETGLEIYLSQESYVNRYKRLINSTEENPDDIKATSGMAIIRKNIALFDASPKCYFMHGLSRAGFYWQERDSKVSNRLANRDAHTITHEILHNLGLFHTFQCKKYFPESDEPNIMSYNPANFEEYPIIGGFITDEQIKIIHSRLAGNCAYIALQENSFSEYRELVCDNE